jgi:hypothetical protein
MPTDGGGDGGGGRGELEDLGTQNTLITETWR